MIEIAAMFVASLGALFFYDLLHHFLDYIEDSLEVYRHKKYCKKNDLPYIKASDANKALEAFMNKPIEEFVEYISEDPENGLNSFRICPKCLEYKRNFMTEGHKRECMDCAIGGLSE